MKEFDIREFGAVCDGRTLNTKAIQAAIDAAAAKGCGRVLISEGIYKTGTICLKTGVNLHIDADAILLGSEKCEDYPERTDVKHVNSPMLPRERNACLIYADECENIAITGMGTIDCNGESFIYRDDNVEKGLHYKRIDAPTPPRVIFLAGCKNVKITDITMKNQPAGWSYWIHDCDFVTIDRCKIYANLEYPNNDGIHINSSRNVTVSNCIISCSDDSLVIRANNSSLAENKVCEKVTVTNCNLTSYSGGVRVGWKADGTIRNCSFTNLVMTDTSCGISILLPCGGEKRIPDEGREDTKIENLMFSHIIMDGIYSHPLFISVGENPPARCAGISNISFSDIQARALEFPYFAGRRGCIIKNIRMTNCNFEKVSDDVLPNRKFHGCACYNYKPDIPPYRFCENIVLENTSFTSTDQ